MSEVLSSLEVSLLGKAGRRTVFRPGQLAASASAQLEIQRLIENVDQPLRLWRVAIHF